MNDDDDPTPFWKLLVIALVSLLLWMAAWYIGRHVIGRPVASAQIHPCALQLTREAGPKCL